MAETRRDPETGGRSLADILREAGVESPARGRRRKGDDTDTGIRQRGSGPDTGRVLDTGRRATDTGRGPDTGRVADTGRGADTGGGPGTGRVAERPAFGRRATDRDPERARERDRTGDLGRPGGERRSRAHEPSTAAIPGLRPSRKPGVPGADTPRKKGSGERYATSDTPSTGPIPVVRADDDAPLVEEPLGPREGAMAWLRFAGELLVALAAGVGIYFLFTVLWELLPYLAVVLAPVAVAGLVGGVAAWRQRQDREPVGVRLVAVLVFAGTLLTIAPAAALLGAA
jgi:hypothetical protein